MKFEIFSIVAGTLACNAKCPFCIASMTPKNNISYEKPEVNWKRFEKACIIASKSNVHSAMITGKGEPTLYPEQITSYMNRMKKFNFPIIELQTNGIFIDRKFSEYKKYLKSWYEMGLDFVLLSVVHYERNKNSSLIGYGIDLPRIIKRLHKIGLSVRINCLYIKNYIDSIEEVLKMIEFAKKHEVEQLTFRNLDVPKRTENRTIYEWVKSNRLDDGEVRKIERYFEGNASKLYEFSFGARIYDFEGQNVCLSNCLTMQSKEKVRQLIFFPDGHVRYSWEYEGAILL